MLSLVLALQQDPLLDSTGAQDPAFSRDGRLAIAVHGNLWIRGPQLEGARWVQVTRGAAWDRQPAWTGDGASLVFTSNRSGVPHLWRIVVGRDGLVGPAERVGTGTDVEGEPTVAPDGRIAFVRGRGTLARVWVRTLDGSERRLTQRDDVERWPAWSPDGRCIAYSAVAESRTRLRLYWLAGDSSRVRIEDRDAEHATWSPGSDRLLFATRTGRVGVWVTTPDAQYVNLASAHRAAPAWSPDGHTVALVELPPADVGYNGDPDRLGDRDSRDPFSQTGHLWFADAPVAPDIGISASSLASGDRPTRNAQTFAAIWAQSDSLYYTTSLARRTRWIALRDRYAARAAAARTDLELEETIHAMMRERPTLRDPASGRAAVSSAHPVATAAGLEMLRRGGNVVDAAVAVSFTLGVVEPDASGIGGYGEMLVRLASMERPALIEFMARAPEEATLANGALQRNGAYPSDGPVLVNVPGTVAGMEIAWRKYGSGRITWAALLAPAIRAADQGYVVSDGLATTLATERVHFLKYPGSRALFFPRGEALRAGDTLRNPDLARTLRAVADSGGGTFYTGDVGRRIVSDLRGRGNAMRTTDLARYYAMERDPVSGTYRGYTIYSSAPPASGGATLVSQLNMLELRGPARVYTEDAGTLHAMIEAWKLVPGTRGRIADPGLWPVHLDAFTRKDSARARWRCFDPARALTPDDIRGDTLPCAKGDGSSVRARSIGNPEPLPPNDAAACGDHPMVSDSICHSAGTTAFAVADAEGNVVSATQTLGTWGGNFYVSPGLGFLYNDKLTSYAADPDEYGARLPNARHGSSLAPTIVFAGQRAGGHPVLAAAAAGNAWITSAVYSVMTGVIDAKLDVQRAIELPRFLPTQRRGERQREYVVQMEDGVAPDVWQRLRNLGHRFERISLTGELRMGYAAAITLGERDVTAAADPRRGGTAGAIGCLGDDGHGCTPAR